MKPSGASSEWTRIEHIERAFAKPDPSVLVGIGDDCAVFSPSATRPGEQLVWSIDAAVEGTHFRRDLMSLEDAGYRATMAALSDLAAMGARAIGVVGSLVLPIELEDADLYAIIEGQRIASAELGVPFVGGNLARGSSLSITTSVIGAAARPLLRSGARPGDDLVLCGLVGLSAAGLAFASKGGDDRSDAARAALEAFRRPRARIEEGLRAAAAGATAMVDVSDGLGSDAGHLATASGARVVLDEALVRAATRPDVIAPSGLDPLEAALSGGEDYALLGAVPAAVAVAGFVVIGRLEALAEGERAQVLIEGPSGRRPVKSAGFDHFRAR